MSNKNHFKINGTKSTFMFFGKKLEALEAYYETKIGKYDVVSTSSCKNMSLIFDTYLRFNFFVTEYGY